MIHYLSDLAEGSELSIKANDHPLNGEWKTFREFHLGGDIVEETPLWELFDICVAVSKQRRRDYWKQKHQ